MKNITFSIDEKLLNEAREKAIREHRSLNELFRFWLENWTLQDKRAEEYNKLTDNIAASCDSGGPFSRDDLNER
jgi:hypothetical protein